MHLAIVFIFSVIEFSHQDENYAERYPPIGHFYPLHPESRHLHFFLAEPISYKHPHDTAIRFPLLPILFPNEEGHLHIRKTSPLAHKRVISTVPLGFPKIDRMVNSYPWLPDVQVLQKKKKAKKYVTVTRDALEYLLLEMD